MNMKNNFKSLPVLSLGLGLLTCVIRVALLTLGRDGKGLLTVWHPLNVLAWAVTAAAVRIRIGLIYPREDWNVQPAGIPDQTVSVIRLMKVFLPQCAISVPAIRKNSFLFRQGRRHCYPCPN